MPIAQSNGSGAGLPITRHVLRFVDYEACGFRRATDRLAARNLNPLRASINSSGAPYLHSNAENAASHISLAASVKRTSIAYMVMDYSEFFGIAQSKKKLIYKNSSIKHSASFDQLLCYPIDPNNANSDAAAASSSQQPVPMEGETGERLAASFIDEDSMKKNCFTGYKLLGKASGVSGKRIYKKKAM
ncbi:hypothetical protein L1887_52811 [Cichorium endivia]|nr:hypothetical protein L1887_52811 [Cichorium endivia]